MTTETQRSWCAMLAKLTAPMNAPDAAQAFVSMLPMLPKDDAAYNRDTLERAARREQGDTAIPNYDRIVRAFAEWRHNNLPVQVRMGGSLPVAQLIAPLFKPTEAECTRVDEQVAALKREFASGPGGSEVRVTPNYLSKLQLALDAHPSVLASRPDYRAAIEIHRAAQEQRQ